MKTDGLSDDNEFVDKESKEVDDNLAKEDVPISLRWRTSHSPNLTTVITQSGRPAFKNQTTSCPHTNISICKNLECKGGQPSSTIAGEYKKKRKRGVWMLHPTGW